LEDFDHQISTKMEGLRTNIDVKWRIFASIWTILGKK
jgi:hypothetical protein